jgi:hypothetical protein
MVVKPWDFFTRSRRGWVQPALKCRVHECVFGVLALDSEPVDPRL